MNKKFSFFLLFGVVSIFSSASVSAEEDFPCKGSWILTGEQKLQHNGSEVPATVVTVDEKFATYTYGEYFYRFPTKGVFPIDIPVKYPHTLYCIDDRLHVIWFSRSAGKLKEVYFQKNNK